MKLIVNKFYKKKTPILYHNYKINVFPKIPSSIGNQYCELYNMATPTKLSPSSFAINERRHIEDFDKPNEINLDKTSPRKIYCLNTQKDNNSNSYFNNQFYKFNGNKIENIKEWLYQFEAIMRLNNFYNQSNIHIHASMNLTGNAFTWFDELKENR